MDEATIKRILDLAVLIQQATVGLMNVISNHQAQEGKPDPQILQDAEDKANKALEVINRL